MKIPAPGRTLIGLLFERVISACVSRHDDAPKTSRCNSLPSGNRPIACHRERAPLPTKVRGRVSRGRAAGGDRRSGSSASARRAWPAPRSCSRSWPGASRRRVSFDGQQPVGQEPCRRVCSPSTIGDGPFRHHDRCAAARLLRPPPMPAVAPPTGANIQSRPATRPGTR